MLHIVNGDVVGIRLNASMVMLWFGEKCTILVH